RAGPQGPGRHRRARPRDLPTFCRTRPGGGCCLIAAGPQEPLPGRPERRPFLFMITSAQNEQLKTIRKLQDKKHRERLGLFAAEGEDLIQVAEAEGWVAEI